MKQRWWRKRLTLMLIAGANRRIVRLKLPEISLLAVPTTIVAIAAGTALAFVLLHDNYETNRAAMQSKFDGTQRELQATIADKDAELALLQTSLIDLTQQAEQFKAKVDEIKQLKQVMAVMTDIAEAPPGGSKAAAPAAEAENPAVSPKAGERLPMGGSGAPPSEADVVRTIRETKQSLSSMLGEMNGLMDSLTESEAKLAEAEHERNITPTLWPTPSRLVTSGFGIRLDPFTERPAMHTGIDFAGRANDPIYAAAEGIVTTAGHDGEHGNYIIIQHGRGLETEYLHMTKLLVTTGQTVKKGQQIGLMGSTGRSTGTHLHYEVHKNGVPIDPRPYLIANRKEEVQP
jgi:murein DD-endopeptidase MepM/ murein hydrolase activator NlpD